jgi:hypothetical protein
MKRILFLALVTAAACLAVSPDCSTWFEITNDQTIHIDQAHVINLGPSPAVATQGCTAWTVLYAASGFAQTSIQVETSSTVNGPYTPWPGVVNYGQIPFTPTGQTSGYINLTGTYNYLRVNMPFALGTGVAYIQVFGWVNPSNVGSNVSYPVASGSGGGSSGGSIVIQSGYAPTSSGAFGYDSLNNEFVGGLGGSTVAFPWTAKSSVPIAGDCAAWSSNFHLNDPGYPCAYFSGGTSVTGVVPTFANSQGAIGNGYAVVTTVGSPGSNSNLATEAAIRTAIGAGGGGSSLPTMSTATNTLVLTNNGTTASWGAVTVDGSGLCWGAACPGGSATSGLGLLTAVIPNTGTANTFTGRNYYSVNPIDLAQLSSAPTVPAAGKVAIYADTAGGLHTLTPAGVNTTLGAGGGGTYLLWEGSAYTTSATNFTTACPSTGYNYTSLPAITIPAATATLGGNIKFTVRYFFTGTTSAFSTALVAPEVNFGAAGTTGLFMYLGGSNAQDQNSMVFEQNWTVFGSSLETQGAIQIYSSGGNTSYNLSSSGTGTGIGGTDAISGTIAIQPILHCGTNIAGLAGSFLARYDVQVWK